MMITNTTITNTASISTTVNLHCFVIGNIIFWLLSGITWYYDEYYDNKDKSGNKYKKKTKKKKGKRNNHHQDEQEDLHHEEEEVEDDHQHHHHGSLSKKEYVECLIVSALNMILIFGFIWVPIMDYAWSKKMKRTLYYGNNNIDDEDTTSVLLPLVLKEVFVKIPIHMLIAEVWIYTSHVMLHKIPSLYKHIHKIHHKYHTPTTICAAYFHPIEFIVGVLFPFTLGPLVTHCQFSITHYIWSIFSILILCKGHMGTYDTNILLRWLDKLMTMRMMPHGSVDVDVDSVDGGGRRSRWEPKFHGDHHMYNNRNYGLLYIMDTIMGTNM